MSTVHLTRREFLRLAGITGAGLIASACAPTVAPITAPPVAPTAVSAPAATATPSGPVRGGVLKIGMPQEFNGLGYMPDINLSWDRLGSQPAIEALARYDKTGRPVPLLAESWKLDADAKTVTIALKKGIKFHDGTDFNAEACKWNIDLYRQSPRAEFKAVKSVDIVDASTVRLNLSEWANTIVEGFVNPSGAMVSPTAFQKNGGKDWATKNPVGTGPFKFASWQRDVKTVYERFEGYWQQGKPYLDRIEFYPVVDPLVLTGMFTKRDVDIHLSPSAKDAKDLEATKKYTMARLTTGLGAAQFNIFGDSVHPNSPFAKSQVRQAIGYAIDKQTICDTLLPGVSAPTEQWGMPGSWSYNPNFAGFKYDPAKAKQLLADAGYPNGFKTNFLVQNAPAQVDLATAIQGYLSKVGIQVNLDPADTARLSPFKYQQAWPEGLIMGAIKVDADVAIQMRNVVHSGGALYTFGMIHPQEIDDLINKALTTADVNSKEGLNRQLQQLVFDKYALFTPIYVQLVVSAKYPDVQDDNFNAVEATMWSPESTWLGKAA